jgi:hypothetical protein
VLPFRINFDERDVVALVGTDEFRGIAALVAKDDFDGLRASNDVEIREDIAARIDEEAGARAFDRNRIHKEVVLSGFGEDVGDGGRRLTINANIDGFVFRERFGPLRGVLQVEARLGVTEAAGFDLLGLVRAIACPNPIGAEKED